MGAGLALSWALGTVGVVAAQQASALAGQFDAPQWRNRRLPPPVNGTDIALTGRPGWSPVPVAFSRGDGSFTVTNRDVSTFAAWSSGAGVARLAGDFNGDG